jgi:NADPH-dependent curcumin reductase CurA
MAGWRELSVVPASAVEAVDLSAGSPATQLGVLGFSGLTAYAGVTSILGVKRGETVFVSSAAGAVGSVAGQIAKQLGAARVIGSAGSAAKVEHLKSRLGFDAAFDYHAGPVIEQLRAVAPEGIDVCFDNVGGEHLEAAIEVAKDHARIALCGMISAYNDITPTPGPRNLFTLIRKRLSLRGFSVIDHMQLKPAMMRDVGGWLRAGALHDDHTVVRGLENAPAAFIDMLRGVNIGKTLVALD